MKLTFREWLLNQNYTFQDFDRLDKSRQFELLKAYFEGKDYG